MNYRALAVAAARRYGIDPTIFLRQIRQESGFNPNARSSAGAIGIAQFMPATARSEGVNPLDPRSALFGAAKMDAANLAKYHNWQDVLSLYNSGRGWAQGQQIGQTRNYVRSILGGLSSGGGGASVGSPSVGRAGAASPQNPPGAAPDLSGVRAGILRGLIAASQAQSSGQTADYAPVFAGLSALGKAQTASYPSSPRETGRGPSQRGGTGGGPSLYGDTHGLNPTFVAKLEAAAGAAGATAVRITSGYRSPAKNKAVGGVPDSNHLYGRASDGMALIPGKGWVPLGTALAGVAPKYGLRSGVTFNYNGKPDYAHVDDAFNQRR